MTVVTTGAVSGQVAVDGLWGELRDVDGAPDAAWLAQAAAHAREAGALDLRVRADPDGRWAALGFAPLDPSSAQLALPLDVELDGVEATRALGARLAAALRPGDLLVLSGPLGAGKTALTQGIGSALGVRGAVTSPTFVLARAHRGPLPLLHVDAYRLRETAAGAATGLADLDLEDALSDGVVVVEWGEGLVEQVAEARLHVRLDRPAAEAEHRRIARVRGHGARWALSPRS